MFGRAVHHNDVDPDTCEVHSAASAQSPNAFPDVFRDTVERSETAHRERSPEAQAGPWCGSPPKCPLFAPMQKDVTAAQHLVKNQTEAEDFRMRIWVRRRITELLRGHIHRGAKAIRLFGCALRTRFPHARETKIQHFHMVAVGDHDVQWLEIAVDDAGGVRDRQGICDLNRPVQHAFGRRSVFRGMKWSNVWPSTYSMAIKSIPAS